MIAFARLGMAEAIGGRGAQKLGWSSKSSFRTHADPSIMHAFPFKEGEQNILLLNANLFADDI
jgi:hypothetical protein